jgi:hypothetical protein
LRQRERAEPEGRLLKEFASRRIVHKSVCGIYG